LPNKNEISALKSGERPQQRPPKTHMKNTIFVKLTGRSYAVAFVALYIFDDTVPVSAPPRPSIHTKF